MQPREFSTYIVFFWQDFLTSKLAQPKAKQSPNRLRVAGFIFEGKHIACHIEDIYRCYI